MPFDDKKWNTPSVNGEVAGVALFASNALMNVHRALLALQNGEDITRHLSEIQTATESLDQLFKDLTGYTQDADQS